MVSSKRQHQVLAVQSVDSVNTPNDKDGDKQQQQVGEQRIYTQQQHYQDIVGREVGQVEPDPALGLAEVGGLADSSEIKEFLRRLDLGNGSLERAQVALDTVQAQSFGNLVELLTLVLEG